MKFELLHPADQIVMLMQRIYGYGMTTTSGGNLSILDDDGNIWITPGGIDKGSLKREDIVLVKKNGEMVSKHKPSVELPFHKLVYETRPDVRAVLHAHPPAMVSFSMVRKVPNIRIFPTAHNVCGEIGVAEYEVPGSIKLGQNIAKVFAKGFNVVMMDNHGLVTCGSTIFEAFKRFETIDYCARINIESNRLGPVNELSDADLNLSKNRQLVEMDEFIPRKHSSEERDYRQKMVELIHRAYRQKLFTSTQGTFSQRLSKDSFLITPYDVDRMYMEPEDLVRIDGDKCEAGKTPSRSTYLHKRIYETHPELNSIIVAHPPHVLAFGITRTEINSRTIPESYIMMRDVKRVSYATNYKDYDTICKNLSPSQPLLLVENDGLIVTGNTLLNAFDRLEVAEFTAQTIIDSLGIGKTVAISDKEVETIIKEFKLPPQ